MKVWDGRSAPERSRGASPRLWVFGDCQLDERTLELKVAGQGVDLDRKPLEVLLYLLHHAGEVVTKDELASAVWAGRIITDSNLTKHVAVVRAALGSASEGAIKTVHGYGYRFVAPVSVSILDAPPEPERTEFSPGDSPPGRPEWRLDRCLGVGGQGDVWCAKHRDTGEQRVFKFADGPRALSALKREVTLHRLLAEMLPDRGQFQRLLDWNLVQAPFFIESELASGGNLAEWAAAQGGWSAVPLQRRLDIVAHVADALSAAHSVGVLHKDLKPSNILVEGPVDAPIVKLADFGSGGLRDTGVLEAAGITRLGFTQTVHADGGTTGTPAYMAPEIIAGQPFTVQSDVYALGVLLYQLVVADTRRALAPGWEKGVTDELLREDIAAAAAGIPADRLTDAGSLAQRLRSLDERRRQRAEAAEAREQAARAAQLRSQLRRTRAVAAALVLLVGAVTFGGLVIWQAREQARDAMETAQAVNLFLNQDLLGQANSSERMTKDLTLREMLRRASELAGPRFAERPQAAAQVHTSLGDAYLSLGDYEPALVHYQAAVAAYRTVGAAADKELFHARFRLAGTLNGLGRRDEACTAHRELGVSETGDPAQLSAMELDVWLSMFRACQRTSEDKVAVLPRLLAVIQEYERRGLDREQAYGQAVSLLGQSYFDLSRYDEAVEQFRKLVGIAVARRGEGHVLTARARGRVANSLVLAGRLDEADAELARAIKAEGDWVAEDHGLMDLYLAILRLEQGRMDEAEAAALKALGAPLGRNAPGAQVAIELILAEVRLLDGRLEKAIEHASRVVDLSRGLRYSPGGYEIPARSLWAEALLKLGRLPEAVSVLQTIELPGGAPRDRTMVMYLRSRGLVLLQQGESPQAEKLLADALEVSRERLGPTHWRTRRSEAELVAARETAQAGS